MASLNFYLFPGNKSRPKSASSSFQKFNSYFNKILYMTIHMLSYPAIHNIYFVICYRQNSHKQEQKLLLFMAVLHSSPTLVLSTQRACSRLSVPHLLSLKIYESPRQRSSALSPWPSTHSTCNSLHLVPVIIFSEVSHARLLYSDRSDAIRQSKPSASHQRVCVCVCVSCASLFMCHHCTLNNRGQSAGEIAPELSDWSAGTNGLKKRWRRWQKESLVCLAELLRVHSVWLESGKALLPTLQSWLMWRSGD